ncbi:MAG: ABC transporter permease subunit [Xenococcaceae cyanobacterium MO_207.B15]|nr:ABC transporter permease subunit [Xenococcaceae cyanobacterium MO_207.B15]
MELKDEKHTNKSSPTKGKSPGKQSLSLTRILTKERIISLTTIAIVFLAWTLVTEKELISPLFLPSPIAVWAAFIDILQNGYKGNSLIFHIGESMYRLVLALVLAIVTAIPLGMLSGFSKAIRAALDPIIEFYRPLPPLAYYTLLVIWLGIENPSKIALLYLGAFAPLYIAAVSGVQRIPRDRLNASLSLGASSWQVFVYVIFPSCMPDLFTGLRTAIGFAYTTLVAAEMVAAVSGIGWMVLDASKFLRSDVIFVGIIIMGIIAIIIDAGIRWVQKTQLPWIGHDS